MRVCIQNYWHCCGNDKVIVAVEWDKPMNTPQPTEEDLAICPERFRCFVCQRIKGKKHFAGIIRFQYICCACYLCIDDRTVRGLISFDLRAGFPVKGYPKRKRLKFANPREEVEYSPQVLAWIKSLKEREKSFGKQGLHEAIGLVQQERLLNSETQPPKNEG